MRVYDTAINPNKLHRRSCNRLRPDVLGSQRDNPMEMRIAPCYDTMRLNANLFAVVNGEFINFHHSRPFRMDEVIVDVMTDFSNEAHDIFENRYDLNTCMLIGMMPEYPEINTREQKAKANAPDNLA